MLSDDIRPVLYRNRLKTPRSAVLAVLCAVPTELGATRDWLKRYASREDIRSLVSDDTRWHDLTMSASTYLSSSSSAVRRDTSRRLITHVLRTYSTTPARARKARIIAAIVGARLLADERAWDTTILNLRDLAVTLGILRAAAAAWLKVAVDEGVISMRGKSRSGEPRVALRSWPKSHKPSAVERAASASILDGEPDLVARWILSAGHPAWHYDDELTPQAWLASVEWSAGLKTPRGRMRALLAPLSDPIDLDLRLEAVGRAGEAAERRAVEKAERAAEAVAHSALKVQVRDVLASWGWTPEVWSKEPAERNASIAAFVTRARSELARIPNAPPLLLKTLERNLRKHIPDRADSALEYIRRDIFDDRPDPTDAD